MTRHQRRLCAYLRLHRGKWIGGYELRDALSPNADVKSIHVQIHNARKAGERRISSVRGPYGGYCWGAPA